MIFQIDKGFIQNSSGFIITLNNSEGEKQIISFRIKSIIFYDNTKIHTMIINTFFMYHMYCAKLFRTS
jgi:hypothetical protein